MLHFQMCLMLLWPFRKLHVDFEFRTKPRKARHSAPQRDTALPSYTMTVLQQPTVLPCDCRHYDVLHHIWGVHSRWDACDQVDTVKHVCDHVVEVERTPSNTCDQVVEVERTSSNMRDQVVEAERTSSNMRDQVVEAERTPLNFLLNV
jgi:hypothetical protein